MKNYYISNPNSEKGFEEVTETEFYAVIGDETIKPYANKVYRGRLSIDEVPEEHRAEVQTVVNNRIARFGEYSSQEVPAIELKDMIEGVV